MSFRQALIVIVLALAVAAVWYGTPIFSWFKDHSQITLFKVKPDDYGAERSRYMERGKGPVKIAIIPSSSDYLFGEPFYRQIVHGVQLAAEKANAAENRKNPTEFEIVEQHGDYSNLEEYIYHLGADPAVLMIILPVSQQVSRQVETLAEYMSMVTFRATHLFMRREAESYLVFNNSYPVDLYSRTIAKYAELRKLQSVAMVTENNPSDNGFTRNVETWLAKRNIPVTTAVTFEEEMINMSVFNEFEKKFEVLGVDAVFWGNMSNHNLQFISDFSKDKRELMKSADHLLILPVLPENIEEIQALLDRYQQLQFDPVIAYPEIPDSEQKREFDLLYRQKYGEQPNHGAYYGYDTMMLVANAVIKTNTLSPLRLAKYLEEESYTGILAEYLFDSDGLLQQRYLEDVVRLGKIENGKIVPFDFDNVIPIAGKNDAWESMEFSGN